MHYIPRITPYKGVFFKWILRENGKDSSVQVVNCLEYLLLKAHTMVQRRVKEKRQDGNRHKKS